MKNPKTEMQLIDKFYELVIWASKHLAKFPRSHKFTVGDRTQTNLLEIHELLIQAKFRRERLALLDDVNLRLEILRFQFRLAKDLQCLPMTSYGYASRAVNEVGQMLGGWIKQTRSAAKRQQRLLSP